MLTFKYRLYPNKIQQEKLWKHANKLNWLYNYFLNQRIENYKNNIKIGQKEQQAELVKLKLNDQILNEIHSQVLQQVSLRIKIAYDNFFRKVKNKKEAPGFPKFRSCKNFFGICYPQSGYKLNKNIFNTKIYGNIKFDQHRKLQGNIKTISINYKNNKWFLNITTDYTRSFKNSNKIAIDIGLKYLVVTNDGEKIENCTHAKYFDKQIAKLQNKQSKLKQNSKKYKFIKKIINRLYDAKIRKINDFQHKVSKTLSSKYDTIYAENLSVKNMSESNITNLNKSIRNAKLAQFISFLKYKTNNLILVNPYNTSKTCNHCGYIHKDLKLKDRTINCLCRNIYDRDINAAKNILCLGRALENNPYLGSITIQEALIFKSK